RYQPVASDLRFIKSCMEVAYGFSRFGRYAHDISDVIGIFGDLSDCDRQTVQEAGSQAKDMIRVSIKAFTERDVELAGRLKKMDDVVDNIHLDLIKKSALERAGNLKWIVSGTLILRYLERIAAHATDVGGSLLYLVSRE